MKKISIAIGYPPINSSKGTPLLSQNRQFQYFHHATYIYPMIPAYAATLLKQDGYEVFWMDGIAEKQNYQTWLSEIRKINPKYLMMETKTPVVKTHWKQINEIKKVLPKTKIILVGDHVTYLPYESFENCKVDYVITGGDYDFVLLNLLNHIYKKTPLDSGIYWRKKDHSIHTKPKNTQKINDGTIFNTGTASLKHNLNSLPFVDRELTKWKLYAYENGNYKYTPATYMYSGRDCWWNRCTFCVWDHTLYPRGSYRTFSPERLFAEVKHVVDVYHVKEIFDDAGTFFIGPKLKRFCELMIESGYNKRVVFGCNMRFKGLQKEHYILMKQAGFRFILYGMESANQATLNKLDKGIKVQEIVTGAKMASTAGLEPHATIMLGYPWETYNEAQKTIAFAKNCFDKGYFYTMQSTIVIPYPGTPLYRQCKENNWLITEEYDRFDMREPVMKLPYSTDKIYELSQELYSSFMTPRYIVRRILGIRNITDIKYLIYSAKKILSHLLDFDVLQQKTSYFSIYFWKHVISKLVLQLTNHK